MIEIGARGLSLDSKTNIQRAVRLSRGKVAIGGNIDTIYTLADPQLNHNRIWTPAPGDNLRSHLNIGDDSAKNVG